MRIHLLPRSLRSRSAALFAAYGLGLTLITGLAGYRLMRASVTSEAMDGLVANSKFRASHIASTLQQRRDQVQAAVRLVDSSCGVSGAMNTYCAAHELQRLRSGGEAAGVRLLYGRKGDVPMGKVHPTNCPPAQVCFVADTAGLWYDVSQQEHDSGTTVIARFSAAELAEKASAVYLPFNGAPLAVGRDGGGVSRAHLNNCLAGNSAAEQTANVLRSYEPISGLANACVVSTEDPRALLAPVNKLRRRLFEFSLLAAIVAVLIALAFSFAITRWMSVLIFKIRQLRSGAHSATPVHRAPSEISLVLTEFDSMAEALEASQAALRESEQQLALAYRAALLWVWEHDVVTGRMRWRKPSGGPERIASLAAFLRGIYRDDRHRILEALRIALAGEPYSAEYRIVENGGVRWFRSWGRLVENRQGHRTVVGVTLDSTDAKQSEKYSTEREKLMAAGAMSAHLAHEINNPLTSIIGSVYMAQTTVDKEKHDHYLSIARQEADRVANIVRQLLQIYSEAPHHAEVDIVALWNSLLRSVRGALNAKQLRTNLRARGSIKVVASENDLQYAFSNVLTNAIEASAQGGCIVISVRACSLNRARKGVRVFISDNGPGLDQAAIAQAFEPFSSTKQQKGAGLGLWTTRSILVRRGGRIRLRTRTTPPTGTTVAMTIPAADTESERGLDEMQ